jgi:hypothetical protein
MDRLPRAITFFLLLFSGWVNRRATFADILEFQARVLVFVRKGDDVRAVIRTFAEHVRLWSAYGCLQDRQPHANRTCAVTRMKT